MVSREVGVFGDDVVLEGALLRRAVGAVRALEGPLPRVRADVFVQVTLLHTRVRAVRALVYAEPRVAAHVAVARLLAREALGAKVASPGHGVAGDPIGLEGWGCLSSLNDWCERI